MKQKISTIGQRKFIVVYDDFLECDFLTSYEKFVFIVLKSFAENNRCSPSLSKLTEVTKISKKKIQNTLKSLEQKHVISIEKRSREDGGNDSNLYTLYDSEELWNAGSSEEAAEIIGRIQEKYMIENLTAKGYNVSKEKELI